MSRIFGSDGMIIPVTVIQAGPCPIVQVKEPKDGYSALQVGYEELPAQKLNKPQKGHHGQSRKRLFSAPA
jgi:large subunit ribosomal protein L3